MEAELERLERERYGIFALLGSITFFLLFLWSKHMGLAFFLAMSLALLASGYYVAKKMTSGHCWAYVEAEGRQNGRTPSRRGIWLGNLLPGFFVLAVTVYINNAA